MRPDEVRGRVLLGQQRLWAAGDRRHSEQACPYAGCGALYRCSIYFVVQPSLLLRFALSLPDLSTCIIQELFPSLLETSTHVLCSGMAASYAGAATTLGSWEQETGPARSSQRQCQGWIQARVDCRDWPCS